MQKNNNINSEWPLFTSTASIRSPFYAIFNMSHLKTVWRAGEAIKSRGGNEKGSSFVISDVFSSPSSPLIRGNNLQSECLFASPSSLFSLLGRQISSPTSTELLGNAEGSFLPVIRQVHLLKVNRLSAVLSGSQSTLRNPMKRVKSEERTALREKAQKHTGGRGSVWR